MRLTGMPATAEPSRSLMRRPVTRVLSVATGLLLVGLVGGCAGAGYRQLGAPSASTAPAGTALASAAPSEPVSNQQAAVRDAGRILAAFRVPRGAVRLTGRPPGTSALAQAPSRPAVANLIDETTWWSLPGNARSVRSTIVTMVPAGATVLGTDEMSGPGTTGEYGVTFDWPPVPGVLDQRLLQAAATDVNGHVILRVDAMVTWLPPRPPGVTIPATATVVVVTLTLGMGPARPASTDPYGPATITDASRVARVAALVNSADMAQIGRFPCPADFGGNMRLEFRASPAGSVLDRVVIATSGCGGMTVTAADGTTARLRGGADPANQIESILGLPWPKA